MIKTIRVCDCCKKETPSAKLFHFISPTVFPEQLELDICESCYVSMTTPNGSDKRDRECVYESLSYSSVYNMFDGCCHSVETVVCLGTKEQDVCPGREKCERYKPKEGD